MERATPNPAVTQRPPTRAKRQFVLYQFFKLDRSFRRLPNQEREVVRQEICSIVERFEDRMFIKPFTTVGIRADADLMLWCASERLEDFTELSAALNRSPLGAYLETSHSFLALTRRSMYVDRHVHEGQEGVGVRVRPGKAKYLFVYPFVKTRAWYNLSKEVRQAMMDKHIEIGHKYPSVRINTAYSYGLDDQEFMVSFESDEPSDFLDLVMELRETEASNYTLRDTPIFTCVATDLRTALENMGV